MKLQKKKERELAEREGAAKTTVIQGIWLLLSFAVAYFLFSYLDSSGILTTRALRAQMHVPGYIPDWGILAGAMLVFVMAAQIALAMGFFIASPAGRRKPGKGDLHSENRSLDDRY